jgi:hypothetical protein
MAVIVRGAGNVPLTNQWIRPAVACLEIWPARPAPWGLPKLRSKGEPVETAMARTRRRQLRTSCSLVMSTLVQPVSLKTRWSRVPGSARL